ncbi:MAG: PASTA domain-containing protein [Candidatus Hydrogenedentes bacterium]|nr:PASTA domain-containing protein [Candidatus Hydrogenedentota bacterium]
MSKHIISKNFVFTAKSTLCFLLLFTFSLKSWSAIPISNILELQNIGNNPLYPVNGEYTLTQDIDASDTVNWNGGQGFTPIGTVGVPFSGRLNGMGFKVIGLYIDRASTDYVGLFGVVSSTGIVENLGIKDAYIKGRNYVGAFVGRSTGTLSNCQLLDSEVAGLEYTGGITGHNLGTVRKSYGVGYITGTTFVGGVVGRNGNLVEQCYSEGSVVGDTSVGGVAGASIGKNVTITRCYSHSSVLGYSSNVGGLVGSFTLNGKVRHCYSTGSVAGSSNTGGLIGYRSSGLVQSSYWNIQTSGWSTSSGGTGKTTAQMKIQSTYKGWQFGTVWGIVQNVTYPYFLWEYVVPKVVGLTLGEAEITLSNAGFGVGTLQESCSSVYPAGVILGQTPLGGSQAPPGSSVNLVVSTGPCAGSVVPYVIGFPLNLAQAEILSVGLTVGILTYQCNNLVQADHVINQDPPSGVELPPGSPVNLVVSMGPCSVVVPDVTGMTIDEASEALLDAGLDLGAIAWQCSNQVSEGLVISQSPLGGQEVPYGTPVDLVLSEGPCGEGEGSLEGVAEGSQEGSLEGVIEGSQEGSLEGAVEGSQEGLLEGAIEGSQEGSLEGVVEGSQEGSLEGVIEGSQEGSLEGVIEGSQEGSLEGVIEGSQEGSVEGVVEGLVEGSEEGGNEGLAEGVLEGEWEILPFHTADQDKDRKISLRELLRVIQFFNYYGFHCEEGTEDSYGPGSDGDKSCRPHASDYSLKNWKIELTELLRLIQFFNAGGYYRCEGGEDGYCAGLPS